MSSLKAELENKVNEIMANIPDEFKKAMEQGAKEVEELNLVKNARKKGNPIPTFGLKNVQGKRIEVNELIEKGPLVISFYRGGWCPFCNLEMAAFHKAVPDFERLGASFIAISPEVPGFAQETANQFGMDAEILIDTDNRAANLFGLVFELPEVLRPVYHELGIDLPVRNGDESYKLPIPATYVVDTNGIIIESFVDPDYRKRLEPDAIIEVLKNL